MAKKSDDTGKTTQNKGEATDPVGGQAPPEPQIEQPATPQPVEQQGQQGTVNINDGDVTACYANFCRVSSSPEELVLDLGLNPHPYGTGHTIKIAQRIILNHYTAKRLLSALSMAVQRHEQAFGVLETDVRKRVRQQQT